MVSAGMSRFGSGFCDISAGLEYLPPECHKVGDHTGCYGSRDGKIGWFAIA